MTSVTKLTVVSELPGGSMGHPIRPKDIKLRNGLVDGRLGKVEVERIAGHLVEFFQSRTRWCAFTLEELREFYLSRGWDPNVMLFGLAGHWFDDGGMGGWTNSFSYLAFGPDGDCHVTNVFIERCAGTYTRT